MLNFAEQTGSGAVMLVWSFPLAVDADFYTTFVTQRQQVRYLISRREIVHTQQPTNPSSPTNNRTDQYRAFWFTSCDYSIHTFLL